MPDQEMLREIKRVLDLTSRVDERLKNIAESHEKMADRFDKFMEHHTALTERVAKLESSTWTGEKIENRIGLVEDEQKKITNRLISVETTAPYALKIVDQSLEALNKLSDRVSKMEVEQKTTAGTVQTWQSWLAWFGDWCFKVAWIVIAAYILARIGLGGINIPAPF